MPGESKQRLAGVDGKPERSNRFSIAFWIRKLFFAGPYSSHSQSSFPVRNRTENDTISITLSFSQVAITDGDLRLYSNYLSLCKIKDDTINMPEPSFLEGAPGELESHFEPNNLKISFFLTKEIPMSKVVFLSKRATFASGTKSAGRRQARNCRICGNGFFPLSESARTCEFCKTPFSSILSGAVVTALKNATG